jgi:acetyl esterase/lipase
MQSIVSLITILFLSIASIAQERYRSRVFENISVETDIVYSTADSWDIAGTGTYNPKDIKLDIYSPIEVCVQNRPTVICLFGGAFLAGNKERRDIVAWCDSLAHYGYVAVAINYRLGFNPAVGAGGIGPAGGMKRAAYRAIQDCRASIHYLKEYSEQYRIDTNQIFLIGNSAGAITAINTIFLDSDERPAETYDVGIGLNNADLGTLNSTSLYPNHTINISGVVGLWGGTMDLSWFDEGEQVPMIFFHGTDDEIVPYDEGFAFNFGGNTNVNVYLYGSQKMHETFEQHGWENSLHLYPNQPHAFYGCGDIDMTNLEREYFPCEYWEPIFDTTINWLCSHNLFCSPSSIDVLQNNFNFSVFPNPASNYVKISTNKNQWEQSEATIYTMLGNLVLKQDIKTNPSYLDVSCLKKGLYLIKVQNQHGTQTKVIRIE